MRAVGHVFGLEGVSDLFEVNAWLRQDCVVSRWLFNVYMDVVVRESKTEWKKRRKRYEGK